MWETLGLGACPRVSKAIYTEGNIHTSNGNDVDTMHSTQVYDMLSYTGQCPSS